MVIYMHIHLYCTNGLCLGVLDWHTNSITYSERYIILLLANYCASCIVRRERETGILYILGGACTLARMGFMKREAYIFSALQSVCLRSTYGIPIVHACYANKHDVLACRYV